MLLVSTVALEAKKIKIFTRAADENSRTWRQIFYGGDGDDNTPCERGPTEKDVLLRDFTTITRDLRGNRFGLLKPYLIRGLMGYLYSSISLHK